MALPESSYRQTGKRHTEIFIQALYNSWEENYVFLSQKFSLGIGFHEIRSIIDSVKARFDECPLVPRTLSLEIRHIVKETAFFIILRERTILMAAVIPRWPL
jgi:hypothetical protein